MGILDKIKAMFQTGQEPEKSTYLEEAEIPGYIRSRDKELKGFFSDKSENFFQELKSMTQELVSHANALNEADISRKRMQEKEMHLVDMGRQEYSVSVMQLAQDLEALKTTHGDLWFKMVIGMIDSFAKSSQKSYSKATYRIGKEIEPITNLIINIRKKANTFLQENQALLVRLEKTGKAIKNLEEQEDSERQKKRIAEQIEKKNDEHDALGLQFKALEDKQQELKNSPRYMDYIDRSKRQAQVQSQIKNIDDRLRSHFDRRIFDKYVHYRGEKEAKSLISSYLSEPAEALDNDEGLRILQHVEMLKQLILNEDIIGKDKDKMVEKLPSAGLLRESREKISALHIEKKKLDDEMAALKIDFSPIETEKQKLKVMMAELKEEILTLKKKSEDLELNMKGLRESMKELAESI